MPERMVLVRDSKDRGGAALVFSLTVWARFVARIVAGDYDANGALRRERRAAGRGSGSP